MLKTVSVKKLFFLLLAAIAALLLLFFVHGPFLDEGVEEAVRQALLAQVSAAAEGETAAEGHRIFQAAASGEKLEVWGVFMTGTVKKTDGAVETGNVSGPVPAKMTFEKTDGKWTLSEYAAPKETGYFDAEMKQVFPWHVRFFAQLKGAFAGGLLKQIEAYAAE